MFSHWPISKEELKHFIPAPFELDTFHGEGWVSLVLFKAMYSRFRWMPQLLSYPPFIQMNLRTYVRLGDQKGIYFLSVDCNHRLATQMARFARLPFYKAKMDLKQKEREILFNSKRIGKGSPFDVSIQISSKQQRNKLPHAALTRWLIERYCFYMIHGKKIVKGSLTHAPWKDLYPLSAKVYVRQSPVTLYNSPLSFYVPQKYAFLHPFQTIGLYHQQ